MTEIIPSSEPPKGAHEIAETIQDIPIIWSGPFLERGFLDTAFEWIAKINIQSILSSAIATLIANHIWEIIKRGRNKAHTPTSAGLPSLPRFAKAARVIITISKKETKIEIDALKIDHETLVSQLRAFLPDETPRQ